MQPPARPRPATPARPAAGYYNRDALLALALIPVWYNDSAAAQAAVAKGQAVALVDDSITVHDPLKLVATPAPRDTAAFSIGVKKGNTQLAER